MTTDLDYDMPDTSGRHIGGEAFSSYEEGSGVISCWRALLIGVRDYEDTTFSSVPYAVEDVTALAEVLRNGGYESVNTLHSELNNGKPTIQAIDHALNELVHGANDHTLLLVYFAGHGTTYDGEAYLLPYGKIYGNYDQYALSVRTLEDRLLASGARAAVLIMDACHAGARLGIRSADHEFVRRVIEQARGLAILSATNQQGVAYEDVNCGHGVFTCYLLEALLGKARYERSLYITASRTYEYVVSQVAAWAEQNHKEQLPTWEPGTYGDLPLLRLPESSSNPFSSIAIRDPERFYGRKDELRDIVGQVGAMSAQSISIVGERGIGKSSLLWQIKNQANTLFKTGHRYVVIYLDLRSAAGASNYALMRTLRRRLTHAGLPAWETEEDGDLYALNYALERLETTFPNVRLVLCLDEFEYVNDRPNEFDGLLDELRFDAHSSQLALVTASCTSLPDLCAQGRVVPSPFFNIFTEVRLGSLDEASWQKLVQDGLDTVSDDDWRFIEECAAGCHPFLTQLASGLLWEARQTGTVDYDVLQLKFDEQVAPHYAYWDSHSC